ncbi:hypothetical protein [Sulfurihydrogenibium sp.]|uniref:hypothetical protein n=1 Tax=Sulfurihydrogenibium sp. TaxID=2053621 RepID=UPI0031BB3770
MLQYMLWYNTERPHHSLNKKSPLQYFCDIYEFKKIGIFLNRYNLYKRLKKNQN